MKKILISIILCGCKTAVSREIKTETRYNQIEINAAMDEIEMEFANCTLLELSFDETNEQKMCIRDRTLPGSMCFFKF